jgi:hypothetical protein
MAGQIAIHVSECSAPAVLAHARGTAEFAHWVERVKETLRLGNRREQPCLARRGDAA